MDWLLAWALFSGSRQRSVLIETPEQREERLQREAESLARMMHAGGRFLRSGLGMLLMFGFLWAWMPFLLDVITQGNRCVGFDETPLQVIMKFISRC